MKGKLSLILLTSSLALAGILLMPTNSNSHSDVLEAAYDLNNHTGKQLVRGISVGEGGDVATSNTFVQYALTEYEGNSVYVMRFATAVKGDIDSIFYSRASIAGLDDAGPQVIDTVYKGINANGNTYYYHPDASENGLTTDTSYAGNYYWACFSIRYVTETFKDADFTVSLNINDSVVATRTANLKTLLDADHVCAPKYVEATVTCLEAGNIAHYACDCGKIYLDEEATQEATNADIASEALGHKEAQVGYYKTVCERCELNLRHEFDAHDPRVIFDGKAKTVADYCGGSNNDPHDIVYYVNSDKETTVDLYSINSAITGSYKVAYNATWNVYVNDSQYTIDTIHKNCTDLGITASNRWTAWHDELAATGVTLKTGVNKIVFSATGTESLNFKGIAFSETDAELSLSSCGLCDACSTSECGGENCDCKNGSYVLDALDEKITFSSGFNYSDSVCIGHKGYVAGSTITFNVNATEALTADLQISLTGNTTETKFNDYYAVSVNEEDFATDVNNVVGTKWKSIGVLNIGNISLKEGANTITISYTEAGATAKYVVNFLSFMLDNLSNGTVTFA